MDFNARAAAAERAARAAGEMLLHHGSLRYKEKADNDFVTELDPKSEKMIRDILLGEFPEDAFYGEESGGETNAHGRWIVDPIDGTQSFMRGQIGWCISIAYEHEGELVVGCVYVPMVDEMFLAVRGQGATLNGKPIHVSPISDPHKAILHFGYGHRVPDSFKRFIALVPDLFHKISDVRRYGTAAYGLCTVACGRSDAFAELSLCIYDIAAAKVILEEAGGKMTGWANEADATITGNVVATNGLLHDFFLETLR
ncbi:MAG: inositol monophosphatase [Candidatus Faecivicinus sp.]|nr:inositol monophosphatase [Candidatus Faecivicinus sp.]